MSIKQIDIIVLIFLAIFGIIYAEIFRGTFWGKSTIAGAFYILPSAIYLSLRKKKNWVKITIATVIFGGLFGFFFEFIAEFNNAYSVISTLFPFKIFGVLPIDNVLGHMMMTFLTIVYYEHFIDREIHTHVSKHFIYALLPTLFVICTVILLYFNAPHLLKSDYPYFYMGLAAIIPPIFLGITKPVFIKNMVLTAIYFFFFWLAIEIVAVRHNWWIYPGNNYVGWVKIFTIEFPFEELFFWMLFYAASLVSYYELFIDDHSKKLSKSSKLKSKKLQFAYTKRRR